MNEEQATALAALLNRVGFSCEIVPEENYPGDEPRWYVDIGIQDRRNFENFRRHLRWTFAFPADEIAALAATIDDYEPSYA